MRFFIIFTLLLLLSIVALPIVAQDVSDEAPVVEDPVSEDVVVVPYGSDVQRDLRSQLAAFVTVIIIAAWNLFYIPVAAPLVELATSLVKRIWFFDWVSSPTLAFFFTLVAWIVYVIFVQLGYGDRFADAVTGAATIASIVFGIPLTQVGAKRIHAFAQSNDVPIFGYSRTLSPTARLATAVAEAVVDGIEEGLKSRTGAEKVPVNEATPA